MRSSRIQSRHKKNMTANKSGPNCLQRDSASEMVSARIGVMKAPFKDGRQLGYDSELATIERPN